MANGRQPHRVLTGLLGLWGACVLAQPGLAAPPLTKMATQLMHPAGERTEASAPLKLARSRLDLALPSAGYERAASSDFPAAPRRGLSMEALRASLPSLGTSASGTTQERILSRPETLARNFKREGLPVARLFQSENSLVHLGLSPKGKPGLWIIEKLH